MPYITLTTPSWYISSRDRGICAPMVTNNQSTQGTKSKITSFDHPTEKSKPSSQRKSRYTLRNGSSQTIPPPNQMQTQLSVCRCLHQSRKPFENFLFELSCTLSEYPSLSVIHCPGRVLSAPDLLMRQLNDVILKRNNTNLSKEQAYILPNLNTSIKPGELIPNNTLYQALNATPEAEYFDVHEKHYHYTQRINWSDYAKPDQLFSSEKEFIIASLLSHSDRALKLSTIKYIFAIKS